MRHLCCLMLLLVTAGPAFATHAEAPLDSAAAMTLARQFHPYISAGNPGPLWSAFDESMRAAMGDSTRFAAALGGIHAQVGTIEEVLSEDVALEHEMWVYRASCRFKRANDPITLLIALTPEGRISGLAIRPGRMRRKHSRCAGNASGAASDQRLRSSERRCSIAE